MIVLQILSLFVWLVAVPFCIGFVPAGFMKKELHSPGEIWISGYIVLFFLLEVVGIPIVLNVDYHGFTTFSRCFAAVLLVFAAAGVFFAFGRKKQKSSLSIDVNYMETWKTYGWEEKIMLLLFWGLVAFQLYMAFTRASFDGDDAYYGVQALTAQQIDVMYRINPNSGWSTMLDARHALALFPIWEAFIGKMSGIHATIVCHSVIPLVLIPLTYVLYYQIGSILFRKNKERLPMFMVLIALWQMFGNVSIYTTETFFLTRTWQGKSFAGNFIIPAVFWIFFRLFVADKQEQSAKSNAALLKRIKTMDDIGLWILLGCLNLAGGASSSLAILLSALLTAGLAVLFAVKERKFSILVKAGCTCILGGVYVILYVVLSPWY